MAALVVTSIAIAPAVARAANPTPGSVVSSVDAPVVQPDEADDPSIERREQEKLTPPSSQKKIRIKQFKLSGNRLFDDGVLLEEIANYLDAPITLEQIYLAADELQRFYRHQGYLLASVYVPAQKVSSGIVRFEIIEGRISSVQIEGELASYEPRFLLRQFDDSDLGGVASRDELDKKIMAINALPGLDARLVIVPGSEYGTSDLFIQATEDRSSAVLRLNNYGRKSLGETRLEGGWLYTNPFSQGDQLNISAIVSDESRMTFIRVDYDALLHKSGTRAGASISAFEYDVDTGEIDLTGVLEGDGINFRLFVSHPFIRQQRNRLEFVTALRSNETGEQGSLAVSTADKTIDLLDLSLDWQATHRNGSSSGLGVIFTSNFKDNDGTESDAVKGKLTVNYDFVMPFAPSWYFQVNANLVSSADPLPDVERYRLGGPGNISAYPSAEVAGDEGRMIRLDVGKRFNLTGKINIIGHAFADSGTVERMEPLAGEDSDETLSGYGAGLLVNFGGGHSVDLEIATPSSDLDSSDGEDTRFWLNYTLQL